MENILSESPHLLFLCSYSRNTRRNPLDEGGCTGTRIERGPYTFGVNTRKATDFRSSRKAFQRAGEKEEKGVPCPES